MPVPDPTGPRRSARARALALRLEAELAARFGRRRPRRPGNDGAAPMAAPRGPGPLPLTGAAALDLPD